MANHTFISKELIENGYITTKILSVSKLIVNVSFFYFPRRSKSMQEKISMFRKSPKIHLISIKKPATPNSNSKICNLHG